MSIIASYNSSSLGVGRTEFSSRKVRAAPMSAVSRQADVVNLVNLWACQKMDRRRSLSQTAEQIFILAKNLVGGFFEIGVNGVFHFAFGKFVRVQLVLQKIQDLLLFFERQFPDFVDDFNRTHAGKLTELCGNSKSAHGQVVVQFDVWMLNGYASLKNLLFQLL